MENKVTGSLLGLVVGDILGKPFQNWSRMEIRRYRPITGNLEMPRSLGAGSYTSATQLTLVMIRTLVSRGEFDPEVFGQGLVGWYRNAIDPGFACWRAAKRLDEGCTWEEAGLFSAGCGAAVRAVPLGYFYGDDLGRLREAAIKSALITNRDPRAIAGAVAIARAVTLCGVFPFGGAEFLTRVADFAGDISPELGERLLLARKLLGQEEETAFDRLGTGSFVLEAVPAACYAFARHFRDFPAAVTAVIKAGGDTAATAAMTGALAGALLGRTGIPREWRRPVTSTYDIEHWADILFRACPTHQARRSG